MTDDWKSRAAGDFDEDEAGNMHVKPRMVDGLDRIRSEWPANRPRICNGGMYVAGHDNDHRPKIMKASRCDNDPDAATGLCESCQGRENDAREAVREFNQPKREAPTGRARFQQ